MIALRGAKGAKIAAEADAGKLPGAMSEKETKLRAIAARLGQNFDEL